MREFEDRVKSRYEWKGVWDIMMKVIMEELYVEMLKLYLV